MQELQPPRTGVESRIEGWKDIARYLGRSVRTVQEWQSEGLPVYRFKKRVWAVESELAQWRESHESELQHQDSSLVQDAPLAVRPRASLHQRWIAAGGVALALLVAAWAAVHSFNRLPNPVRYGVEGMLLRTFDSRGHVVWESALPSLPAPGHASDDQVALLSDLDGDGRNELLFAFFPRDAPENGSILFCFRSNGSVAWKRGLGRSLTTRIGQQLGANYNTVALAALSKPRDDGGRVVVVSNHVWSWPSQVAVLTAEGELVSEYWHPGWLMALTLADQDRDGIEEVALGGVNNSCGQTAEGDYGAALVILDSRHITGFGSGCSSHWGLPGVPAAPEMAVLQFPEPTHPDVASAYYWVYRLRSVGGQLEIDVQNNQGPSTGNVIYRFNQTLGIVAITPDSFVTAHLLRGRWSPEAMVAVRQKLGRIKVLRSSFARSDSRVH